MKKLVLLSIAALASGAGMAQEVGRVISSTPVIQQVAVPRQVCGAQTVAVQQPTSGAGAVIGAIAGGALGNAVGGGAGRAVATMAGVLGGAVLGNQIESNGNPPVATTVPQCSTQTAYENRTVGYNVVYEYAGRQYTAQMPNDPGQTIPLQIGPAAAAPTSTTVDPNVAVLAPQTQMAQVPQVVYAPAVYPAYYPSPYYYPPIGVSVGFGYWGGHRGHWR